MYQFKKVTPALFLLLITLMFSILYLTLFPQVASNSDELTILFQVETFLKGKLAAIPPSPKELFVVPMLLDEPLWVSRNWPFLSGVIAISRYVFHHDLFLHAILLAGYAVTIYYFFRSKKQKFGLITLITILICLNVFYHASFVDFYRSGILSALAASFVFIAFTIKNKTSLIFYYIGIFVIAHTRGGEGFIFFLSTIIPYFFHQKNFITLKRIFCYFITFSLLTISSILFYTWKTTNTLWPHPNILWSVQYQQNNPISIFPNRENVIKTREEVDRYFVQYEDVMRLNNTESLGRTFNYYYQKLKKYSIFHFGIASSILFVVGLFTLKTVPGIGRFSLITIFSINFLFLFLIIYDLRDYTSLIMPLLHIIAINGFLEISNMIKKDYYKIIISLTTFAIVSSGWLINQTHGLDFSYGRPYRSNFHKPNFEAGLPDGKNFIFVQISKEHNPHDVWVYNLPFLEEQKNVYSWLPTREISLDDITSIKDRRIFCMYIDNSFPIMLHEISNVPTDCKKSWKELKRNDR